MFAEAVVIAAGDGPGLKPVRQDLPHEGLRRQLADLGKADFMQGEAPVCEQPVPVRVRKQTRDRAPRQDLGRGRVEQQDDRREAPVPPCQRGVQHRAVRDMQPVEKAEGNGSAPF